MKKKIIISALLLGLSASSQMYAKSVALGELKNFSIENTKPSDNGKAFDPNHWAYRTLKNVTDKYGVLMGKPGEKFDGKQSISRNEAAIILVNLMGKIEEQNTKVNEADRAKIEILQQELGNEMNRLSGRVAMIEKDVAELKGSVSTLQASEKKALTTMFGEDFKLTGGLQAAYTGALSRGADGYSPNFGLPYSEVTITGKMTKHMNYKAQLVPTRNFTDTTANGLLRDVYFTSSIIPKHTVYVGQMARPVGKEATLSPMEINFVDYAQASRKLLSNSTSTGVPYNHDVGAKIDGDWGLVNYSVGAFNGTGQNAFDNNRTMTMAGRVSVKPFYKSPQLGDLEFGGSMLNGYASNTTENICGIHGSYKYKKFGVSGEFLAKDGFLSNGQDAHGFFIDTMYNLTDKLQILARYDSFDPDLRPEEGLLPDSDSMKAATEYVAGVNYLLRDNVLLMLNFAYVNSKFGKDSNRIGILSQVMF